MRFASLFKLSTRTFRTRPGRTLLTILGISIGIGAVLFLVSLGYGLQKMIFEQITTEESLLTLDIASPKKELFPLDRATVEKISNIENIAEVSPKATFSGQIILEDLASDLLIYASEPSYFKLGGILLTEGKYIENRDENKTILSTALLKTFNLTPKEAIGKEVKFTLFLSKKIEEVEEIEIIEKEESYQVIGVIEDDITTFAYLPIGTLNDLSIEKFSDLKVKVSAARFMEKTREELINMGFMVSSLSEMVEEANKIFNIIKIVLAIFGLVALFVAAVGLVNTMTVALLERTNEIGIMKAIGGRDEDIGKMFLVESTLIGFLGGVGGIVLAKIGAFVSNGILNMLARGLGGQTVSIFYTPFWFIIFIIVFSALVGFLSGLFPAKRASSLNPLEALRYK